MRARRAGLGLNGLTAAFGSALFERALADAAGRLSGRDVVGMLRDDVLGIRPDAVHPELTRGALLAWAGRPAPESVAVRHTVITAISMSATSARPGCASRAAGCAWARSPPRATAWPSTPTSTR